MPFTLLEERHPEVQSVVVQPEKGPGMNTVPTESRTRREGEQHLLEDAE